MKFHFDFAWFLRPFRSVRALLVDMPSRRPNYDSESEENSSVDSDFEYDSEDDVDIEIENERQAVALELRAPFEPMFSPAELEKLKKEPANFELSPSKQKRPNNQARLDVSMFAPIPTTTVLAKFLRRPAIQQDESSSASEESESATPTPGKPRKAPKRAELDLPQTAAIVASKHSRYDGGEIEFSDSSSEEDTSEVSVASSLKLPPKRRPLNVPRPPASTNSSSSSLPAPSVPGTPITEKLARLKKRTLEAVERARASS